MDTEHPDSQRRNAEPAQPGIPPTLALLIEQHSDRFTTALQAFRAELDHQLQAPGAKPTKSGSDALAHLPAPPTPSQIAAASEPATRSRAHPRQSGGWTQGWQQEQPVAYRRLVVIWTTCLIVGFGIGIVIAVALR